MKYRRRNFRRRKQPWYKRRYNAYQLAIKAWKGLRYVKGLVNSEMFHKDTVFSPGSTIPVNGVINHLTGLTQGDTDSGRTGNSILLRSLAYRYKLEINPSVTANTSICVILFWDKQQQGDTNPVPGDLLSTLTPEALINLSEAGRFKIISRKNYILTPSSGGRPSVEVKGYHKLYKHIRYNGTSSSDIQKNGLYMLLIHSENTNLPTIGGTVRIGYHDN